MSPDEMSHPDHIEALLKMAATLFEGVSERAWSTYQVRHRQGHWIWVDAHSSLVRDQDGKPFEVMTTIRDVTRRTKAEELLKVEEARYRSLTDALPQMVWIISCTDDLVATYVNEQFQAFYGPIGSTRQARVDCNHADDAERMAGAWLAAEAGKRSYSVQGRIRRHDGIYRWHQLVVIPVLRDGDIVEWIGTALDIDEIVCARNRLAETTELLRLAQKSAGAGVWDWNMRSDLVSHSPISAAMHAIDVSGAETDEATFGMTMDQWRASVCPADLPGVEAAVARAITERTTYKAEFRTVAGDGSTLCWIQASGLVCYDGKTGHPNRIVGLNIDMTARRTAEQALRHSETLLRASEERLALALDSCEEGLWDWNLETRALWVSDRWFRMLGYKPQAGKISVRHWKRAVHRDDALKAIKVLKAHVSGLAPNFSCEYRVRKTDGTVIWVLIRGKVVERHPDGRAIRVIGTQFEITRRKEAEARAEHMARHDALTGLPNRALFRERLGHEFDRARGQAGRFAVLCLDLDGFKQINDALGHPAGDALLKVTADRMRPILAPGGTIARLGGDEFVFIVPGVDTGIALEAMVSRLLQVIVLPVDLDGRSVQIGASIGIAIAPTDGSDPDTLFRNADIALYDAKASGRGTYRLYGASMGAAVTARNQLDRAFRDALDSREFSLVYQPILNAGTRQLVGFEALLRWTSPTLGPVPPSVFIPLAEQSGAIVRLGAMVIDMAAREAASWPEAIRVAVNVSAVQFSHPGLESSINEALAVSGLAPSRLELEVTESVLMQDSEAVLTLLHRWRCKGIRVALDDFGTGYSSLSYLRRFPFDKIKIDRSFIAALDDTDAAAIVETIVTLAHRLGSTITAEGVETDAQASVAVRVGCDEAQGYLYSRPLTSDAVADYIHRSGFYRAA